MTKLFCKHCGTEYRYVNPKDPGTCWGCQKPLEVQKRRPVRKPASPKAAAR